MKIVWICNFSNEEVVRQLKTKRQDYAPWISMWLEKFVNDPENDLHIISPHRDIPFVKSFQQRGINYYFYNYRIPIVNIAWPLSIDSRSGFLLNRLIISYWIKKIKPDMIHIIGAENSYYSASFFDLIPKYPILIGIQGFISLYQGKLNTQTSNRIAMEKKIMQSAKYFSVHTDYEAQYLRRFNPTARIFKFSFELSAFNLPLVASPEKKYDCVFYGRVEHHKGIFDAMEAVGMAKASIPTISLLVIGKVNEDVKTKMQVIIDKYDLSKNTTFIEFIPSRDELFKMVQQARIGLLPSLVDITPGTVTECILLKIPVISYAVGALTEFNKDMEVINLIEPGNKELLSKELKRALLNYSEYYIKACNAREHLLHHDGNINIRQQYLSIYHQVLDDYRADLK